MSLTGASSGWGSAVTVSFRNVYASPEDDVRTWPFEALVTVIERGLVPDWKPVLDEIRHSPWGAVARRVERYLSSRAPDADDAAPFFALVIEHARREIEATERSEVASRVQDAIASTGLTDADLAECVGTSASRLSTYRNGKVMPSAAMLVRIENTAARLARDRTSLAD